MVHGRVLISCDLWPLTSRLGPIYLFDEPVGPQTAGAIHKVGPSYFGSFQAPVLGDTSVSSIPYFEFPCKIITHPPAAAKIALLRAGAGSHAKTRGFTQAVNPPTTSSSTQKHADVRTFTRWFEPGKIINQSGTSLYNDVLFSSPLCCLPGQLVILCLHWYLKTESCLECQPLLLPPRPWLNSARPTLPSTLPPSLER